MKHSFFNKISLLLASTSLIVAGLSFNNNVSKVSAEDGDYPDSAIAVGSTIVLTGSYTSNKVEHFYELTGVSSQYGIATEYSPTPSCDYPLTVVAGNNNTIRLMNGTNYLRFVNASPKLAETTTATGDDSCWICTGNEVDGYKFRNLSYSDYYLGFRMYSGTPRFTAYKDASYITIGAFEVLSDLELSSCQNDLDVVEPFFSLGFSYEKGESGTEGKVDSFDTTMINYSASNYANWSNPVSGSSSSAVYVGNSYKSGSYIQLNNTGSAGIVTTVSGGNISMIKVFWNSDTVDKRSLTIYGKNTAYSSSADLYDESTLGTQIGTIVKGQSTTLVVSGSYQYIGLLANGAIKIDKIEFIWDSNYSTSDLDFRIRVGVSNAALPHLNNYLEYTYGVEVKTSSKSKKYEFVDGVTPAADNVMYQVIKLGDIIKTENKDRINDVFTIRAYMEYNGAYIYSDCAKNESALSLMEKYYSDNATKDIVSYLYHNLLFVGNAA